jgi:hypothetical protein
MKAVALMFFLLLLCALSPAQANPVPFVNQPLVPMTVAPGSSGFTLMVNGTGFVSGAIVNWNDAPLTTTFVSSSQLTATVPAANVAKPGTASVTVINPAPGGGTSSVQFLHVSNPTNLQFTQTSFPYSGPYPDQGTAAFAQFQPVAADFNDDGKLDLAVPVVLTSNPCILQPCSGGGFVVLLGNGDGTFRQPPRGSQWVWGGQGSGQFYTFASSDFNGDGTPDFGMGFYVDANPPPYYYDASVLSVAGGGLRGLGGFATIQYGNFIGVGDFNADGVQDYASGSPLLSGLSVFIGQGGGNFQQISANSTWDFIGGVGDFNGDGKLDLIGYNATGVAFFRGNGDGTFHTPTTSFPVSATSGVVADLNGDGKLDLIASAPTTVTVLLGNGDGTFQTGVAYQVGGSQAFVDDINADGKLDLAVSDGSGNVYILLGNGDGTFQTPIPIASGYTSVGELVAGDFNGDGKPDLAVETPAAYGIMIQEVPLPTFSPTSLTFSALPVNTPSAQQQITLSNPGGASAPLTIASISAGGDFSHTNTCGGSVPINGRCTIIVTFTPTAGGSRQNFLTVIDSAPNSPQKLTLTGTGMDFSLMPTSQTSVTVAPGQVANYSASVIPESGFNQTVTLTCSGAPPQSTCTVTPSSVTLDGSHAVPVTIAVVTAGPSAALNPPFEGSRTNLPLALAMLGGALGFLAMPGTVKAQRKRRMEFLCGLFLLCLVSVVLIMPACGGGSGGGGSSGGAGTPAGTYNLTVTGTFSSGSTKLTHSTNFTMVVQ